MEDSLRYPRFQEFFKETEFGDPRDLPTETLLDVLNGRETHYFDLRDVREILLRRKYEGDPLLVDKFPFPFHFFGFLFLIISIFGFFGWKLYHSLKDREKKREEKKKLKQKKKK